VSDGARLYAAVRKILWEDWDPIGCGVPEDEYDSYATPVVHLILRRRSAEIAGYLHEVRTILMGLSGDRSADLAVARRLVELSSQVDE
jgi:hypothetical protein